MTSPTLSKRPYLLRAMHEWMGDCGQTPHIVVDATVADVVVPKKHVKDGRIVLNISDTAAHNLDIGKHDISFRARFSGVPFDVFLPVHAVLGIYARETGQGMIFSQGNEPEDSASPRETDETPRSRSHLKIIK